MIAIVFCGKDQRECALIARDCREQVARGGGEQMCMETAADDEALSGIRTGERLVHLLYYTFRKGQPLQALRAFRRQYSDTMVMLLADKTVSPLEYLHPGVAPDSLLPRPVDEAQLKAVNAEFMQSFFENFHDSRADSSFVVETREEKVFIPYSHIYYFEARDKKLFVRVKNEEYAFYDTIEALGNRLPDTFRRCHRSYIVNTGKIVRIRPAENYIELSDQLGVPISRSYKAAFRGVKT